AYDVSSLSENDPMSRCHDYASTHHIEIAGMFSSVFAWGLRKTIINKSRELLHMMDDSPYDFILHHTDEDLKVLENFRHRTFQPADALYFVHFLHHYFHNHQSLEEAFRDRDGKFEDLESGLINFHQLFFNNEYALDRTRKHIPSP